jgi:hypothetical protein
MMRLSAGGCYEIAGRQVRRLGDGPSGTVMLSAWRGRQADLQAESVAIAHMDRHLTNEEIGLWNAMATELDAVQAAIEHLGGDGASRHS